VRFVLDTNVVVAAMRSPRGALAELLRAARAARVTWMTTAPLCFEDESVCQRPEHARAAGLTSSEVGIFVDAVVDLVEPVEIWFMWRPQLRDPGDELVLEAAVNGRVAAIITFNRRDFQPAAGRFGIEVLLPSETVRRVS
jgi:predicted nucleic acid-binding protein